MFLWPVVALVVILTTVWSTGGWRRTRLTTDDAVHRVLETPRDYWLEWRPIIDRLITGLLHVGVLAIVSPQSVGAQVVCGDSLRLESRPASPRPGTLFVVRISGAPRGATLDGTVAGEPLHFDTLGSTRTSLAAAPVDSAQSLGVAVFCRYAGAADTLRLTLTPSPASYPVEKLVVAPEFTAPPDSALRERLAREGGRANETSRRAHETPRLWHASFRRPRPSRVTSGYGRGREFNGLVTSRHMGTDYAGRTGAPVRAVNRGVVRIVDRFFLGGNVIYLDHGGGVVTAYLHLSRQLVAEGDTAERGALIGRVGATGRVTAAHLHLIARYGNISVDPLSLFTVHAPSRAAQAAKHHLGSR